MPRRDRRVLVDHSTLDDAGRVRATAGARRWCRPSTSSRRSWTTRTTSARSPRPTRSRTCTPWAGAADGARAAVLSGRDAAARGAARDPARRAGQDARGGGQRRRRPLGARSRAQVRLRRDRRGQAAAPADQRGRASATGAAHQAARHRHPVHRAQAATGSSARCCDADAQHGDAQPRRVRGGGGAWARAATDVTGFSLLGHASQMADASGVTLHAFAAADWLLPRVRELILEDVNPGGLARNRGSTRPWWRSRASSRACSRRCTIRRPRAGC